MLIRALIPQYRAAVDELFEALDRGEGVDEAIEVLKGVEGRLDVSMAEVHRHAENTAKIKTLRNEVDDLDNTLNDILKTLFEMTQMKMRKGKVEKIEYEVLMKYASKIARSKEQRYPTEQQIRRGRLAAQAGQVIDEQPLQQEVKVDPTQAQNGDDVVVDLDLYAPDDDDGDD